LPVPYAPETLTQRVPVPVARASASSPPQNPHHTYVNTNNSGDPTPDTGHEEATTTTTRRQSQNGEARARRWHIDGAMAAVSNPEGDEAKKEEVQSR
jgi:hypothetical protein